MIFHLRNELRNLDFQGCRIITEQDVKRQNGPKITQGQQTPKNLSQYHIFFFIQYMYMLHECSYDTWLRVNGVKIYTCV